MAEYHIRPGTLSVTLMCKILTCAEIVPVYARNLGKFRNSIDELLHTRQYLQSNYMISVFFLPWSHIQLHSHEAKYTLKLSATMSFPYFSADTQLERPLQIQHIRRRVVHNAYYAQINGIKPSHVRAGLGGMIMPGNRMMSSTPPRWPLTKQLPLI